MPEPDPEPGTRTVSNVINLKYVPSFLKLNFSPETFLNYQKRRLGSKIIKLFRNFGT